MHALLTGLPGFIARRLVARLAEDVTGVRHGLRCPRFFESASAMVAFLRAHERDPDLHPVH